jgi:hypothetical protein
VRFLNLNDCEIKTSDRCDEIFKITGKCDVLISQFSYAAWKGGKENISWRKKAAQEKLDTLELQVKKFNPTYLIPFASFVSFSNERNFYLNDSVNTPMDVVQRFELTDDVKTIVMQPFDILDFNVDIDIDNKNALGFWSENYLNLEPKNKFEKKEIHELNEIFMKYKERIFNNNSKILIKIARLFSPIPVFNPLNIYLDDIKSCIKLDIFSKELELSHNPPDIEMSSESLYFIMQNTFGFDTLTVNGCFEERKNNGFSKMAKSLAIENLNNIGIKFNFYIILNFRLVYLFLNRLKATSKKISNT